MSFSDSNQQCSLRSLSLSLPLSALFSFRFLSLSLSPLSLSLSHTHTHKHAQRRIDTHTHTHIYRRPLHDVVLSTWTMFKSSPNFISIKQTLDLLPQPPNMDNFNNRNSNSMDYLCSRKHRITSIVHTVLV
jgi:hypothetical protein